MIKKLLKDSSMYTVGNLASKIIGFLTIIFYTKLISVEEFGQYDYIMAIGAIVGVLIPLEVGQSVQRFYSDYGNDTESQNQLILTAIFINFCTSSIFSIIAISVNQIYHYVENSILALCLGLFFMNSCVYIVSSLLVARTDSFKKLHFSLLNQILSTSFSLGFIVLFQFQSLGIIIGQTIGSFLCLVIYSHEFRHIMSYNISKNMIVKIFRFSVPLVPSSIGVLGMTYADRLMLDALLGLREVGIYGISVRVAAICLIVILALRTAITPLIYKQYSDPSLSLKLALYLKYYFALTALCIICSELFATTFVQIMFGSEFDGSVPPISLLIFSMFISNCYMFFPGITLKEKTLLLTKINIVGLLLNIPLNFILISVFGLGGAALATLLSSITTLSLHIVNSQRYYKIGMENIHIFCIIVGLAVLLISFKILL